MKTFLRFRVFLQTSRFLSAIFIDILLGLRSIQTPTDFIVAVLMGAHFRTAGGAPPHLRDSVPVRRVREELGRQICEFLPAFLA